MQRLPLIDGLRGIAMLGVIYSHTFLRLWTPAGTGMFSVWGITFFPLTFFTQTWMGVSLFFILSGFVLTLPFASGERPLQDKQDILEYCKRRALRLFPVYWAIMIPVMLLRRSWDSVGAFFYDAAFVLTGAGALHPTLWRPWYYSIVWTLEVEILFSLCLPFLFFLMRRYGRTLPLGVAVIMAVISQIISVMYPEADPVQFWEHWFIASLPDFVAGMAAAFFYAQRERFQHRSVMGLVGVALVYLSFSLKDAVLILPVDRFLEVPTETLFTVGATILMLLGVTTRATWVKWMFANVPLRQAGIMCYSFYLHHYWLIKVIKPVHDRYQFAAYVGLLISFTLITYHLIEKPIWRKKTSYSSSVYTGEMV